MATDTTKEKPQQLEAEGGEGDGATATATPAPSAPPSEAERIEPPPAPQGGDPGTLSGQPLKDLGDGDDKRPQGGVTGAASVKAAASGRRLTDAEQQALDWLLKSEPDPGEIETKVLELNFGTSDEPRYVNWEIQPVGLDKMRRIRTEARSSRKARKTGVIDETRMNLQVIIAGTKTPDVRRGAEIARQSGNGSGDPVEILRARFQSKPGYIAQISAEIMTLSGFDEDDVKEKEMVEAAGNS